MDKILIIGAGNVATNIGLGLKKAGYEIAGCYSRSIESARFLAKTLDCRLVDDLQNLPTHELILVCVPDASIADVIAQLPNTSNIAYTSGTVSLDELPNTHKIGVFYPLQTFTKNKQIDVKTVPFFVESNDESLENSLLILAKHIGLRAEITSSEKRKQLHVAAVFVNNFTNHLAYLAQEHVKKHELSWENLLPLLAETFSKLNTESPKDIQTGPARRKDLNVIKKHLSALSGNEKEIYKAITNSILNTYHA
jgi:predicted short-subunit dehydrogenase-like oxidoreductase (DUF2520 family)